MAATRAGFIALAAVLAAACSHSPTPSVSTGHRYEAEIRWTSYGIPHVTARDSGSLGYGFAYATSTDGICVIAREVATANGTLVEDFGVSPANVVSDVAHKALLTDERMQALVENITPRHAAFAAGYVAGYNRYLRDHEGRLPGSCSGEDWVRPLTVADYGRMTLAFGTRYALGPFVQYIAQATPPGEPVARFDGALPERLPLGSNAIAVGGDLSATGRGILFGNPHFPWHGPARFHMIHTTIPGELDVMGASLLTGAFVIIGFNADVAWTHTISTAQRYTLYELELDPDDPMRYRYGDGYRSIETMTVTVGGEPQRAYFSHYGPLLANAGLPWSRDTAYAVRLAAFAGDEAIAASLDTYEELHRASSVGDVEAAISLGGSWLTNTVAADRHGNAFYADISAAPNVDDELLARCRRTVTGMPPSTVVLDGSRPDCEWQNDPRSSVPGNMPADEMPRATSRDYFTNSNDSYWLSNPDQPLEGYPKIIGPERSARSLRTRSGLLYLAEVIADDGKVAPEELQQIIFSHRHFGAELLADDVLKLCADAPDSIADSCAILADWDRRARGDSRGTQLWTEFWEVARQLDGLYREPFDPERPVNTPRGLDVEDPAIRAGLVNALESAAERLAEASVPADAPWGQVQFADRNGERIAVPGARGWHGVFSYIDARLNPGVGYTPIRSGNSYIQIVSWTEDGALDARGILTYSQSPDPASPHYADQTHLYSRGEWIDLPFDNDAIKADPNLRTLVLQE